MQKLYEEITNTMKTEKFGLLRKVVLILLLLQEKVQQRSNENCIGSTSLLSSYWS